MATDTYTQYTQLPGFVQPYAEGYLQRAQQVADQPYQPYGGQRVAGFAPWQQQGLQAQAQRAMMGSPLMGAANEQLQQTIQGGHLQGNPYLDAQIQAAQGDATRSFNEMQAPRWAAAAQRSGSFGNTGLAQVEQTARNDTQRNLARIGSDMRYQNYDAERTRQMQALGMAPQFAQQDYADIQQLQQAGAAYQGQQQKELDNQYLQFLEARNYPREQLGIMGDALGRSYGQQTTSQQPGANPYAQALGGGLSGLALYKMLFGG